MKDNVVLEVSHLKKYFDLGHGRTLHAVDDVSFSIREGETLGLVGESGCGKTTCGRTCLGMYNKTDGQVLYRGKDVHALKGSELFAYKREAQMVFQDPYASLDPRMTVSDIIAEGMDVHHLYQNKAERAEKIYGLLEKVGLNKEHANRFIHEFSGGQRQRIGIARSLAVEPEVIICDEPTSALDVSIQAQVINLLKSLQEKFDLTLIFISHNLSLVKYISDRVGVMYLGSMVELSTADDLYEHPAHPYTQALISAIPIPDPVVQKDRKIIELKGDIPSPINTPDDACSFASRCPYATPECAGHPPRLEQVGENHFATCDRVMKGEQAV